MPDLHGEYSVLGSLERSGILGNLVDEHRRKARLKTPAQLLDDVPRTVVLPPPATCMIALNAATESGLPHFHRLLSTHLGEGGALRAWTDMWTAEEHRHEMVLSRILERTEGVSMHEVDRLCFAYLEAGFRPDWEKSPYRLIAYTVLQEAATRAAYHGILPLLPKDAQGVHRALRAIAAEEEKHRSFYFAVFRELYVRDSEYALEALLAAHRTFTMPGGSMPGFRELALLADRLKVFDLSVYASILEDVLERLSTAVAPRDQSSRAKSTFATLADETKRCRRLHHRLSGRSDRLATFPFIPGVELSTGAGH